MIAGRILQRFVKLIYPEVRFKDKLATLHSLFNHQYLQNNFQEYHRQFFEQYDISLLDEDRYLRYDKNEEFIYFWNIPRCSFGVAKQLLHDPHFNYSVIKGIALSVGSQQESSTIARELLRQSICGEGAGGMRKSITMSLLKVLTVFYKMSKVYLAVT